MDDSSIKSSKWAAAEEPLTPEQDCGPDFKQKNACSPIFTKSGYTTVPDFRELQTMGEESLSRVEGFEVHREGFGSIKFEGRVDLRWVNLDEVISIDQDSASVYESVITSADQDRPDVGVGLNCPAEVTLYNVRPQCKNQEEPTQEEVEKFVRKIKKTTTRCGADLIEYSPSNGLWRMRMPNWTGAGRSA